VSGPLTLRIVGGNRRSVSYLAGSKVTTYVKHAAAAAATKIARAARRKLIVINHAEIFFANPKRRYPL
jgi:hypothetical protein